MSDEQAIFKAAFPPIMTAIKVAGDQGGMRIQLDVPESEMAEAVKLLAWRQRVLVVTIGPETSIENSSKNGPKF